MMVKELRAALEDMPGEMPVYLVGGEGVRSALHRFEIGLNDKIEQSCQLAGYFQSHGPAIVDNRLERAGFTKLEELLTAYAALKEEKEKG